MGIQDWLENRIPDPDPYPLLNEGQTLGMLVVLFLSPFRYINTELCLIKDNSNIIELTLHTS